MNKCMFEGNTALVNLNDGLGHKLNNLFELCFGNITPNVRGKQFGGKFPNKCKCKCKLRTG